MMYIEDEEETNESTPMGSDSHFETDTPDKRGAEPAEVDEVWSFEGDGLK